MNEFISKEKYDYEIKSLNDSLVKIAKNLLILKEENQELRRKIYRLEQFSPMKKL